MKKITLTLLAFLVTCCMWQVNAQTYPGTTGPVPTVGTSGNAQFTATVPLTGTIGTEYSIDNVTITNMNHTFDGDLDISLIAPSGEIMLLSGGNGGSGDNYVGTVFNNGGNPCIESGAPPFTGTFEPEGGLTTGAEGDCTMNFEFDTVFDGVSVNGDWILNIEDNFGGDSGNMNAWEITFSAPQPFQECGPMVVGPPVGTVTSDAVVTESGLVGPNWVISSVDMDISHTFDGDLEMTLISPNATPLILSSFNGGSGDNYTNTVFQDGGADINAAAPPFTGTFEPEGGTLNGTFAGEDINGNWTLQIFDSCCGEIATLNNFCINFVPNSPPIIVCPGDVMANTDPGECGAVVNFADAVAVDPEDGPIPTTQTMGPPSGSQFPVGVTVVEYSATDSNGATSTCQFTVTVTDNEDPTVTCMDITVELDSNGMATIFPADVVASSGDNCPGETVEFIGPGTPFSLTTSFADNNGSAGNMFDVMPLNDIIVNSFDVNNSSGSTVDYEIYFKTGSYIGSETTAGDWMLVGSALGVPGNGSGNATPLGLSMGVALTAGNMYSFYVADIGPGTHNYINGAVEGALWASDANLEVYEGVGKGGLFGSTFRPRNFSGNVVYETTGTPVPSLDFGCADVGTNDVTVIITDASGNTASCMAVVTVEDNIAPIIACIGEPFTQVESVVGDNLGAPIDDGLPPTESVAMVPDSGPIGATYTIESVELDITHTFDGDLDIELESPTGTVLLLSDQNGGSGNDFIGTIFADGGMDITAGSAPFTGTFEPEGGTFAATFDGEEINGPWTLRVIDNFGGDSGTLDNFVFNYSFDNSGAPLEVDLDANGMATINASALLMSVDEACGWTATVPGTSAPMSLETTFAGGNGQSGNMFDIMAINDLTIDSFDVSIDAGTTDDVEIYFKTGTWVGSEDTPGDWALLDTAVGITSNGDNVPTPLNLSLGQAVSAGETVAFYVTLVNTTDITYTNGTNTGDLFASDANMEFYEGAGKSYPFGSTFQPRIFNGNIIYSTAGGSSTTLELTCDDLGENQIEVTVTDDSGNVATCIATVNVNDVTAPVLICQDVTIELGPDGTAEVDPAALLATTDGVYDVLVIGSDNASGTEGFTDFTVAITDATDISFDWDYTTNDVPGFDSFGYLLNGVYTQLTDPGLGNQNGSAGPIAVVPGDVFGFRNQTDDNDFGNSETVISNFMPGFNGQFAQGNWNLTLTNSDGDAFFVEVIPPGQLSFDACGITVLAVDITDVDCDDIAASPLTAMVFASDASGNIAACNSMITVVDLLGPEVTCPPDQTVDPGAGNQFYEVPDYWALGEATATDNCTDPLTIFAQDPVAGTFLSDGVYPITISSTDEYGNVGSCVFELTVESVLGVDDTKLENSIVMYPNPAQDQVTIANTSNILLDKLSIFDANGRLINQVDLSDMQQEKTIDVSQLATGVYMVQIQGVDASTVKRLVKE